MKLFDVVKEKVVEIKKRICRVRKAKVIYIKTEFRELITYWRKFLREKAERRETRRILVEEDLQRYLTKKGLRKLGKEIEEETHYKKEALKKDPCVVWRGIRSMV